MKTTRIIFALIGLLILPFTSKAQNFQFGVNGSMILSQIEGDQLRGFNKLGYSFGLLGGFSYDKDNWLVVGLNNSIFGSKRAGEKASNQSDKILVASRFNSINVMVGYSRKFGDNWDDHKRFRFLAGLRFHRLRNQTTQVFNKPVAEEIIFDDDDFKNNFLGMELGFGVFLVDNIVLDLTYSHVMGNVLKEQKRNIVKLAPFYLSFTLSYYIF